MVPPSVPIPLDRQAGDQPALPTHDFMTIVHHQDHTWATVKSATLKDTQLKDVHFFSSSQSNQQTKPLHPIQAIHPLPGNHELILLLLLLPMNLHGYLTVVLLTMSQLT